MQSCLPVVCDLDGVVWLAGEVLPGAPAAVARLRDAGAAVAFFTNNSSESAGAVATRLADSGIPCAERDVMTSAGAAAELLVRELGVGASVLACAGPGVGDGLVRRGLEAVDAFPADAVVVGWHRDFDFEALDRASDAVRRGALFVATNLDATYPVPGGLVPGNGALVAAVAVASGREPTVAGKPHEPAVALVRDRFAGRGVVIGDRPSTDGAFADALDWDFALVRSAVTHTPDEEAWGGRGTLAGDSLVEVVDGIIAGLGAGPT